MWKVLNRILICLFIGIGIWYFYDQLSMQVYDRLLIGLAIIPVLLGPWIIKKLFHYEMCELLKFCYYLFALLGLILGSVLKFYQAFPGFDKFVHFLSGIITSIVALIFLKKSNTNKKKTPLWFQMLFIILFTLGVASIWEFFEYFCDNITGGDAQYVAATGVDDTMNDMLIAFAGGILFNLYYAYQMCKAKRNKIELLEKCF